MKKVLLSSLVLLVFLGSASVAATRRVPNEYSSIQQAIDDCNDGDTVIVGPGVYYETINFGGRNIVVTSTDPNDPKIVGYTIIDAEEDGSTVTFENRETTEAVLTGFTITGGVGTLIWQFQDIYDDYKQFGGAGIYCSGASPTITRNVIANNHSPYVQEQRGNLWIYTYSEGGGIYCSGGSPVITYNIIRDNSAYDGGGISAYGYAVVANNLIYRNSAGYGGGVVLGQGYLVNNTIVNNDISMQPEYGQGGNVYATFSSYYTDLIIANNIITGAKSGGGLFVAQDTRGDVIRFNNVWDNVPANYGMTDPRTSDSIYGDKADWTGRFGNISADPLFRNPLSRNFHLEPGSPCISAGDPNALPVWGTVDMDGEPRVFALRVDIGADEFIGYVKPLANAGADQHVLTPQALTLDGSGSYFADPCGVRTYRWSQTQGPAVELSDPNASQPEFTPPAEGWYGFQLVVGDGQNTSVPDRALVVVGNQAPVADAGPDKLWAAPGMIGLDGSNSHDDDPPDDLRYSWQQVEGPPVTLDDANTAIPRFTCERPGVYVFQLTVSDGFVTSTPDTVKIEAASITVKEEPFTMNVDAQGYYILHPAVAGAKIACATEQGADYAWAIQCVDMETGRIDSLKGGDFDIMPKMDGDIIVWTAGTGRYYNPGCTGVCAASVANGEVRYLRRSTATDSFGYPAISGKKVVWLYHRSVDTRNLERYDQSVYDICGADISNLAKPVYFTVAEQAGHGSPYPYDRMIEAQEDPVDICGNIVVWEADGDIYGADISDLNHIRIFPICTAPERQYDPSISGNRVVWTDERNDAGDIYGADISEPNHIHEFEVAVGRGAQLQPDIDGSLIAFIEGNEYGGTIRTCCLTREYGIMDFYLPGWYYGSGPEVDGTTIIWQYYDRLEGTFAEFAYGLTKGPVENTTTGMRYDYIQQAISAAREGEVITVPPGTYPEKIRFRGKNVIVTSTNPEDPVVRAATIITGPGQRVTFADDETADCVFTGFTVAGGSYGIFCGGTTPTISNCTVADNTYAGLKLWNESNPIVSRCEIMGNERGVEMWAHRDKRIVFSNYGTFRNCLIAGNRGDGIYSGYPTLENCTVADNLGMGVNGILAQISNSILYFNRQDAGSLKVEKAQSTVAYSDVQGGWAGEGNIDADPLFVARGVWSGPVQSAAAAWVGGDYHLKSEGWTWDASQQEWTWFDVTSPCIDMGDPNVPLGEEPVCEQGSPLCERAGTNWRINMGAYGGTPEASLVPRWWFAADGATP
jgi:beta propeller repeat protein/parallel beta-helix repeat protein